MFKFLKEKLKAAVSKITKRIEEVPAVEKPIEVEVKEEKPSFIKKREKEPELIGERKEPVPEVREEPEVKKGFFAKLTEKIITKKISADKFEDLFSELELALLENNVALEVVEKIKSELKEKLVSKPITIGKVEETITEALRSSLKEILELPKIDLVSSIKESKKPYVILFLGYNGSGKSITIAKVANYLKERGLKPILAAADTFRAAGAIQLAEYASKINLPVVKHADGSDSCSVIFDTIKSAEAKSYDIVLADTAGRMHSNKDLMKELEKIVRVNKPNLKILVIDALTGSDVVEQAEQFDKAVGIDAIILTKVDVYEKGGSVLSAAFTLKKPILFFGIGQDFKSIKEYDAKEVLSALGL